jgi:hypothetical protein
MTLHRPNAIKKRFGNTESSSYFASNKSEKSHRIYAPRAEPGKVSGYVLVLDVGHEQPVRTTLVSLAGIEIAIASPSAVLNSTMYVPSFFGP